MACVALHDAAKVSDRRELFAATQRALDQLMARRADRSERSAAGQHAGSSAADVHVVRELAGPALAGLADRVALAVSLAGLGPSVAAPGPPGLAAGRGLGGPASGRVAVSLAVAAVDELGAAGVEAGPAHRA